jgi:DMSO/TMAO reductase YedYZ molybdopterin-dependent catalytic subunit
MPRDADSRYSRRRVLAQLLTGAGAALLAGCEAASRSPWFSRFLGLGEHMTRGAQRLVTSRRSLAQEFDEADLSPEFRSNGTSNPKSAAYQAHAGNAFADWALRVDGLVEAPATFTLAELRNLPSRTQITRHDCVEGWSAIGKWTGVPLSEVLSRVVPLTSARFAVFHCADPMPSGDLYYESIDMEDAYHPQTLLAYELNGNVLPIANGAPLRLRVERQLGYKMAKYVMRVELVASFAHLGRGKGGYWPDRGYEWFAGI